MIWDALPIKWRHCNDTTAFLLNKVFEMGACGQLFYIGEKLVRNIVSGKSP